MSTVIAPFVLQNEADFEVEDILNEIGLFSDDYELPAILDDDRESSSKSTPDTTEQAKDVHYIPVTPSRSYQDVTEAANEQSRSSSPHVPLIAEPASMKHLTSFSVPNPIASFTLAPPPKPIVPATTSSIFTTPKDATKPTKVIKKRSSAGNEEKGRKRKLCSVSIKEREERGDFTEEEMEERRQRNREHAKRSRLRKKSLTAQLQQSVEELKSENTKLRNQIYAAIGQEQTESMLIERKAQESNLFLSSIRDPKKRILDESMVAFLKSLQKNASGDSD